MKYDGNEAMTIHYHTYTQALYMYKYSVMQINSHPQMHTHEELRRKVWNTMKYKILGIFMGGVTGVNMKNRVNMKNSILDAFDRFKCPMNTNRNHYKANFDNIVYREQTSYSTSQNSKTYSPKWLELKDIANVWWPPICLERFL